MNVVRRRSLPAGRSMTVGFALLVATLAAAPVASAAPPSVTVTRIGAMDLADGGAVAFLHQLYFTGWNGDHEALYKSDGTGVSVVFDFTDSVSGNPPGDPDDLFVVGSKVFFNTDSQTIGTEPWVSNGTAGATHLIKDIFVGPDSSGDAGYDAAGRKGKLYWEADDGTHGGELAISDGTPSGTRIVDINRHGSDGSWPDNFTRFKKFVYFEADDGTHGYELWRSDGTSAGTKMIKDIVSGSVGGDPVNFMAVGPNLFFSAATPAKGRELWLTNPTSGKTKMVKDANPGAAGADPQLGASFNNRLYFTADDGAHGPEFWVSDGTAAGTKLVKDLWAPAFDTTYGSDPNQYTPCGSKLFFLANTDTGPDLFISDGTAAGTHALGVGGGVTAPDNLTCLNGNLFFSNWDATNGDELWISNGTSAGTGMVQNINTGSGGADDSSPHELTVVGSTLFFFATDTNGQALYTATVP